METQLAPELKKGDVVILDNVAFHKSERAAELVRQRGAWLLHLPAYSPDLNPIEMAFSKLKTPLRKRAGRSFDAICDALKDICSLFSSKQRRNFFKAAEYEANETQRALVLSPPPSIPPLKGEGASALRPDHMR